MTVSVYPPLKENKELEVGTIETITKTGVASFAWSNDEDITTDTTSVQFTTTYVEKGSLGFIANAGESTAGQIWATADTLYRYYTPCDLTTNATKTARITKVKCKPLIVPSDVDTWPSSIPSGTITIGIHIDDGTGKPNKTAYQSQDFNLATMGRAVTAFERGHETQTESGEPNIWSYASGTDPYVEMTLTTPLILQPGQKAWVSFKTTTSSISTRLGGRTGTYAGTCLEYKETISSGTLAELVRNMYNWNRPHSVEAVYTNSAIDGSTSTSVTVNNLTGWKTLSFTKTTPTNTTLVVDLYDNKNTLIAANISSPYDLSALTKNVLVLKARLTRTSTSVATPTLSDVSVSWDEGQSALSGFEGKKPYIFRRDLTATTAAVVDISNGCGMAIVRLLSTDAATNGVANIKITVDGRVIEDTNAASFTRSTLASFIYGLSSVSNSGTYGSNNSWGLVTETKEAVGLPWIGFTKSFKVEASKSAGTVSIATEVLM